MKEKELKELWKREEAVAKIQGWDFSYIHGRYESENDLPWNYTDIIRQYLTSQSYILDYDTGGGEFLLSLQHPHNKTAATEGYGPNVEYCRKKLLPLGITFRECDNPSKIPFEDETFDLILNRHGKYDVNEVKRLLKNGGVFITQQVGRDNDRELIEMVLPRTEIAFPQQYLRKQVEDFRNSGFEILMAEEVYRPIKFYDVGAFVWFARIIEWEFPGFSVERCFDHLLKLQEKLERKGIIEGRIHRFMLVAQK